MISARTATILPVASPVLTSAKITALNDVEIEPISAVRLSKGTARFDRSAVVAEILKLLAGNVGGGSTEVSVRVDGSTAEGVPLSDSDTITVRGQPKQVSLSGGEGIGETPRN